MANLDIISPEQATGRVREAYQANVDMYARAGLKLDAPPQVYRTCFAQPEYLDFGTLQAECLPNYPIPTEPPTLVPGLIVNFAVAKYSACFY
ncbi:MAG: hypothetical protein ACE5IL_17645 [Myxococcota bacterium]